MAPKSAEASAMEREHAELESVLRSAPFVRAPALARLLSYLCAKLFAGEADEIKEYSIALDVFGRAETFDQDLDSIVRVQANRLRKRLAEFYRDEGAGHPLQIVIPVGQYIPAFQQTTAQIGSTHAQPQMVEKGSPVSNLRAAHIPRIELIAASISLIALLGIGGFFIRQRLRPRPVASPAAANVSPSELPAGLPVGDEVRILAGATRGYVDRSGKVWLSDAHFTGGTAVRSSAAYIWRTQDPTIYRTSRQGEFSYNIPLRPGNYELHLHFAETFYGPENSGGGGEGSRIMTVTANGKPLLVNFDVLTDAAGARTAEVRVFTDVRPNGDGLLHLNFSSVEGGRAMLSAIELLPGAAGQIRPVRIIARDMPYYSDDSRWWSADKYFKGGQLRTIEETATGTEDPEFYSSERWGHFSYAIPVPRGKYRATLYFMEHRPAGYDEQAISTSAGSSAMRMFSVFCNRQLLLRDLNIFKEVGRNRPLVKQFSGLEPNAQGKLLLEFVPTRGYAVISAIEVVPE